MEKSFLEVLVEEFEDFLGKNLVSILLIGSVLSRDTTPFSDIDLIMIVKKVSTKMLAGTRNIIKNKDYFVDLSVMSVGQIPKNPEHFQMGTHGCYFLEVLRSAEALYGKQIFFDYPLPNHDAIIRSIFKKLAEYNWFARRLYVESNRERTIYQNYQLSSRLIKSVKDTLRIYGSDVARLGAKETIQKLMELFPKLLTRKEKDVLLDIINPDLANKNAANMSEDFLTQRIAILNKLLEVSLEKMNP